MEPHLSVAHQGIRTVNAYWSSAYFLIASALYLFGYWSTFGINVLEFLSVADVVKTAAYPIASVFAAVVLGGVIGQILFPHGFMPYGGGADSAEGRWLRGHARTLASLYAAAVVLLILFGPPSKWDVLPGLVAAPLAVALNEAGLLSGLIPTNTARTFILFFLVALPPFSYGLGLSNADKILNGKSYTYASSQVGNQACDLGGPPSRCLRYVGKAGDNYFFYVPTTQSVLIILQSEVKVLELKRYPPISGEGPSAPNTSASTAQSSAKSAR